LENFRTLGLRLPANLRRRAVKDRVCDSVL